MKFYFLPIIFTYLIVACQHQSNTIPPKIYIENRDTLLQKTDYGWLYKHQPFSGYMTEKEQNGKIVYQLPIIHGKENGLAKAWYNTGEKLLEKHFVKGKLEGVFRQWWPNGHTRYLFHYHQNQYQGKQLVFFPNGKKREESNFQVGEREGIQKVWDENGILISNYILKNQKVYGFANVKSCLPTLH